MDSAQYDISIVQGATWKKTFVVSQPAEDENDPDEPVDITGCTIRAQIRKRADEDPYVVDLNTGSEITLTDPSNGEFRIHIPYTVTTEFPTGSYVWDLFIHWTDDTVDRIWYGDVELIANITEPTIN